MAAKSSAAYGELMKAVAVSLDDNLNAHVADMLRGSHDKSTRSTLLLQETATCCAALFRKWPDQVKRIRSMLNQAMPVDMRREAWAIVLSNPSIRTQYLQQASVSKLDTVSVDDLKITQQCEAMLANEPALTPLLRPAVVAAMKTALSYRQMHLGKLSSDDYFLIIPLLYTFGATNEQRPSNPTKGFQPSTYGVEHIIEFHSKFLDLLRGTAAGAIATSDELPQLFAQVLSLVQASDSELISVLAKVLTGDTLPRQLALVLGDMVRRLLVGYLSLDAVCFVWDQQMIGFTTPRFAFLPHYIAAIFLLLRDELIICKTVCNRSSGDYKASGRESGQRVEGL